MIYSNLKQIMQELDISVSSFSKQTGLARTTLIKILKSELVPEGVRIETLERISSSLGLAMNMVFPYRHTLKCSSTVILNNNNFGEYGKKFPLK